MSGMIRRAYQTDLSDAEWSCIENYLPAPKVGGRPKIHDTREILDAIFYLLRSGWVQSVNFLVLGTLMIAYAIGLHLCVRPDGAWSASRSWC
jgi:hypothetical protein